MNVNQPGLTLFFWLKYYKPDQTVYRGIMRFHFFPVSIRQHYTPNKCHFRQDLRWKPCRGWHVWFRFMLEVITVCAFFLPAIAPAQPPETNDTKSRWSGRVEQGTMGIATTSRVTGLDPDEYFGLSSSYAKIDSLDKNLDYENFVTFFLLFNVNYQLTETSSLYVGTPFFDDNRQGFTVGIQKLFPDDNLLDLSVFIDEDELWQDPYLTGVKRELTWVPTFGLIMDTDGLFGSPIHMNYMVKRTWVEDDVSGDNDSRLRRDGYVHELKTGYNLYTDESFESLITPSFIYTRDDREGGANAFNGYGLEISYSTEGDRNAFMMSGSVETDRYDEVHPVFSKRRNDMDYTLEFFYTRKHLWVKNLYLRLGCVFNQVDSSIGFFSETNIYYGFSIGYSFG